MRKPSIEENVSGAAIGICGLMLIAFHTNNFFLTLGVLFALWGNNIQRPRD